MHQDQAEKITAAANWLLSNEGRLTVARQFLKELEEIEDWENCIIVRNKIIELETKIENEIRNTKRIS